MEDFFTTKITLQNLWWTLPASVMGGELKAFTTDEMHELIQEKVGYGI